MAKNSKNRMWLDTSGMERWIEELDKAGADIKEIVEQALTETAMKIKTDTLEAVQKHNLPAKGRHSKGVTKRTVLDNAKVRWEGGKAIVNVGFDQTVPGASIYLITGTPKMEPARKLKQLFRERKYMSDRTKEIAQFFQEELERITGNIFS